jgi:fucose 4-O-acetylase-like acetyltransferase
MRTREPWIDVLKGLGIVAVVVGHVTFNHALVTQIFMFHMPLFFALGGWLHDSARPQHAFALAKARSLLVPYACFLLVLWPLELLFAVPLDAVGGRWSWALLGEPMLFGGRMLSGFAGVFWFVTCYFLTQQLVHCMLRRLTPRACAAVAATMLALAYLVASAWPQWTLPWSAEVVLFGAPVYLIGHAARGLPLERWTAPLLLAVAGALLLNVVGAGNTLDLKAGHYGLPLVTLASALAVTALLAVLARRIHASLAGRALAALGAASMTIMFLHQFVQLMVAKQFGVMQASVRIVAALAVCLLAHQVIKASPLAARLLLGRVPVPAAP